jgi:hypothetical protein
MEVYKLNPKKKVFLYQYIVYVILAILIIISLILIVIMAFFIKDSANSLELILFSSATICGDIFAGGLITLIYKLQKEKGEKNPEPLSNIVGKLRSSSFIAKIGLRKQVKIYQYLILGIFLIMTIILNIVLFSITNELWLLVDMVIVYISSIVLILSIGGVFIYREVKRNMIEEMIGKLSPR